MTLKEEDEMVKEWALSLNNGEIPECTRERILQSHTAEADDLDSRQPICVTNILVF